VFVPEWASAAKLALIEGQGAELRRAGADMDEAKAAAQAFAAAEGWFFFEDGAEPAQFDAYGAIGDELLDGAGRGARHGRRPGRQRSSQSRSASSCRNRSC